MPDIGVFHPQIVHFVIGLLYVGAAARVLSLLPLGERFRFLSPMATTLLILGALAAIAAVPSGTNAHGPVERIPGAREIVSEHEEWGERTRNVFVGIAVLEIAALLFASRRKLAQGLRVVTALGCLVGFWLVFEVGDLGGDIVYEHAGGPGIRSGKPEDIKNVLVAGLYHNARLALVLDLRLDAKEAHARIVRHLSHQLVGETRRLVLPSGVACEPRVVV